MEVTLHWATPERCILAVSTQYSHDHTPPTAQRTEDKNTLPGNHFSGSEKLSNLNIGL